MKKSDFEKVVKDMLLEHYLSNGEPTQGTDPKVTKLPSPERTDSSECCNAPMKWEGITPYCTKCWKETEPAVAGNSFFPHENMHEIYNQFKGVLQEGISEKDFAKKIRGVVYEYVQGIESTTPTATDPTRSASGTTSDIVRDPDGAAKAAVKDADAAKEKSTIVQNAANQIKNTNLKEYVDNQILPAVIEIIKQADNPRATKRELLEFFKLTSK
jgi:hypothetical protein